MGEIVDTVSDAFGGIGDFVSDNAGLIGAGLGAAFGVPGIAGAGLGGGLAGGVLGNMVGGTGMLGGGAGGDAEKQAEKAIAMQKEAFQQSLAAQMWMYNQQRADLAPMKKQSLQNLIDYNHAIRKAYFGNQYNPTKQIEQSYQNQSKPATTSPRPVLPSNPNTTSNRPVANAVSSTKRPKPINSNYSGNPFGSTYQRPLDFDLNNMAWR